MNKTTTLKYLYFILVAFLLFSIFQVYNSSKTGSSIMASDEYSIFADTLHILASSNLNALLPYDAIFADDVFLINQVYQGLVKLDNHLVEIPDLAKYWTVDTSHTRYTFFLKENQIFHNGDTVQAKDVVESLEYFLRNKKDSYIHPYFKVIEGVEEFCQGNRSHAAGIKIESVNALSFHLKHPYIPFLKLLTLPEAKVLPSSILGKKSIRLSDHPIGSGPYFVKHRTDSHILLEAFRWDERKEKSVGVKYFKLWLDQSEIFDRLDNNKFDISYSYLRDFIDSTNQFDSYHTPSLSLTFLGINSNQRPTDNKMLRKALFYGIDQDEVRKEFGSIANPVNFYCPLNLPRDVETYPYQRYDSLKAKRYLKLATHQLHLKEAPELSIAVDSTLFSNVITNVVLRNLDKLGIPYKISYYSGLALKQEAKLIRHHNLFIFGWYMDVPDPEYFFDVLFNTHQPTNLMGYSNAVVDSLLAESYSSQHLEKRLQTYMEIERILMEDVPIVALMNDYEKIIFRNSLKNVMFNRLGIVGLDLSKIRVQKENHQENLVKSSEIQRDNKNTQKRS
jgi:ABC-type oligopeptide transport system substrate-binding subunit